MVRRSSTSFAALVTVVVINLDSRPERWKRTRFVCRLHGMTPIRFAAHTREQGVERFPDVHISPGARGLWSSFVDILEGTYDTEWLLVFEDDAVPLPRFRHHVLSEIRSADDDLVSIRVGWLGKYRWRWNRTAKDNLDRLLRNLASAVKRKLMRRPPKEFTPWGTHALLLRTSGLSQIENILVPFERPLDHAFIRAEETHPHIFRRTTSNYAWQWPDRSDIQSRRK